MFKEDIEKTIGKILKEQGYRTLSIDEECVYYMKRYSGQLAFYIRCRDIEKNNRGISIEMFFAPIQMPNSREFPFEGGVHIYIITVYRNLTDKIVEDAGRKVVAIENKIGDVSKMILEEIEKPYFPNKVNETYKESIFIYETINKDKEINEKFTSLKNNVCKVIKESVSDEIFGMCNEFIESLPKNYLTMKGIDLEINDIKEQLAEYIYAQCMLDA